MKISRQALFFAALTIMTGSGILMYATAAADAPVTDAQIAQIRASCVTAKNTLDRLHASDALLRVNRGQLYESITAKLMVPFDARLNSNHIDATNLSSANESYISTLATFRTDYQAYEVQLSTALNIDCNKQPVTFYDAVISARAKRSQVHDDITKIHGYIDAYKIGLDALASTYSSATPGVSQ